MAKFLDFDALRTEMQGEPIEMQVFGKTYGLPAELPASIMLDILRAQAESETGEIPAHKIVFMAEQFLGKDVMAELLANPDFSMKLLSLMIEKVVAIYTGSDTESPLAGKAK